MNDIRYALYYFRNVKKMQNLKIFDGLLPSTIISEVKKQNIKHIDNAILALKKQLPVKVKGPIRRGQYADCPVCGIELSKPWCYCYKCGQKVLWSDEE